MSAIALYGPWWSDQPPTDSETATGDGVRKLIAPSILVDGNTTPFV